MTSPGLGYAKIESKIIWKRFPTQISMGTIAPELLKIFEAAAQEIKIEAAKTAQGKYKKYITRRGTTGYKPLPLSAGMYVRKLTGNYVRGMFVVGRIQGTRVIVEIGSHAKGKPYISKRTGQSTGSSITAYAPYIEHWTKNFTKALIKKFPECQRLIFHGLRNLLYREH